MWWSKWDDDLVARFGPREELPREGLIHRVWGYFDAKAVGELLDELECNFDVPAGIMRPDDPLRWLVEPRRPATRLCDGTRSSSPVNRLRG